MVRKVTVYVDKETWKRVKKIAIDQGKTLSQVVGDALAILTDRYEPK